MIAAAFVAALSMDRQDSNDFQCRRNEFLQWSTNEQDTLAFLWSDHPIWGTFAILPLKSNNVLESCTLVPFLFLLTTWKLMPTWWRNRLHMLVSCVMHHLLGTPWLGIPALPKILWNPSSSQPRRLILKKLVLIFYYALGTQSIVNLSVADSWEEILSIPIIHCANGLL